MNRGQSESRNVINLPNKARMTLYAFVAVARSNKTAVLTLQFSDYNYHVLFHILLLSLQDVILQVATILVKAKLVVSIGVCVCVRACVFCGSRLHLLSECYV